MRHFKINHLVFKTNLYVFVLVSVPNWFSRFLESAYNVHTNIAATSLHKFFIFKQ